jgi:hypothetical protein
LNKSISDTSDGMSHNINRKVSIKDWNNQYSWINLEPRKV